MFYQKMGIISLQIMENHRKKKVFSIFVFRPFHVPINLCLFVLHLTLRDIPFSIWHFQRKVTAIASRKQILTSNMIMVPHLDLLNAPPHFAHTVASW